MNVKLDRAIQRTRRKLQLLEFLNESVRLQRNIAYGMTQPKKWKEDADQFVREFDEFMKDA